MAQPTCTASAGASASAHLTPTAGTNCAATAMMYSQCSRFIGWCPTANLCIDCAQPLNTILEGGPISRGLCPACLHELQVGCWRVLWQSWLPPCYDLADDLQCQSLVSNVIWWPPRICLSLKTWQYHEDTDPSRAGWSARNNTQESIASDTRWPLPLRMIRVLWLV